MSASTREQEKERERKREENEDGNELHDSPEIVNIQVNDGSFGVGSIRRDGRQRETIES